MVARRIHVELVIGIAEHFALARNEVGVILAHEGVRRSEADLYSFEVGVEADVFRFAHDQSLQHLRRDKAWFPLSELAFLPVNLGFRTSGEVETMRTGRTLHLRGFRPVQSLALPETSHYAVTTAATGTELGLEATRTTLLRVQLNRKPAYAVAGAELARFYLASLGMVAHRLLVADLDLDGAIAKLVDPERTGRIDDLSFQIAPLSPLGDAGAALQLAMILASPDLLQFWRELSANVRQEKMGSGAGVLDAPAPAATKHVVAHVMPYTLALPDRDIRALRVTRIDADMRPPPFATLIVHSLISHGDQDEDGRRDEDGERDDAGRRPPRRVGDNLKLNRNERPGRIFVKLAALGQSFTSAFPRFKEVEIQHVGGTPRPLGTARGAATEELSEASTLPSGGNSDIVALIAQPNPPLRPRPPVPAEVRGNLLDELPREPMRRTDLSVEDLPYPLELFAKAVLRANGRGYVVPEGARFPLFEMDPKWGAFSMLRAERSRLAAIGWLDLESARVCAIEMERRYPKEALATGLFVRADRGALSLAEAAAVLRYTCQRQEIDEGLTWRLWPPDGLFADLRATSVTHHHSRSNHIPMSDELVRRASLLAGEQTRPLAA